MKTSTFYQLFLDYVQELYDAEQQIVAALPEMIEGAYDQELIGAFSKHLHETKEQVKRLERIFTLLGELPKLKTCITMRSLIEEGKRLLKKNTLSPAVKDCFLIICAQKIEHYEIAAYGSARTLAKHMRVAWAEKSNFKEIYSLFEETLKEESNADKSLTKVAEGKLFCDGVNDEVEGELKLNMV